MQSYVYMCDLISHNSVQTVTGERESWGVAYFFTQQFNFRLYTCLDMQYNRL